MKQARVLALGVCLCLVIPTSVRGAGYGIYEQGAAVLGMAGAGTASVEDASAVFFNPAAMTRLEGTHLYLGSTALTPITSFAGVNPYPGYGVVEEMDRRLFMPPIVYVTRRYEGPWAVGVGLNTPFGLGVEWKDPDRFTGRYIVVKADLQALNLGLSAAYQVNPLLSVAAGGNAMFSKVELKNRTLAPPPGGGGGQVDVAEVKLASSFKPGYGWNAAVSFAPNEQWRLGASYRGKVTVDAEGDAEFRQILTGDPAFDAAVAAGLPPDQGVSTVLRFPAIWSMGVAWIRPETWKVEASLVYTEWSLFRDIPLRFDDPSLNTTIVEDYDDALAIRVGAEHRLASYTYRFGYYFEQEAAPPESVSPLLPDAPRHGVTLGLGLPLGGRKRWTLDLYNLSLFVQNRDTEGVNRDGFDGEYKSYINAFGLSLGYRW